MENRIKKVFKRLIVIVAVAACFAGLSRINVGKKYEFSSRTLVSGIHVQFLATLSCGEQLEDAGMQIVYQLARRSVVKIEVKDFVASGIVWKIDDDRIVIVSNRHLLMKDVNAKVTFCNDESADAKIIGYSQQYDIGFLKICGENVLAKMLRDIYEAVPAEYEMSGADSFSDRPVLQIGADLSGNKGHFSMGHTIGMGYEPVFNTNVLKTKCYAKAGMSGGGVFDAEGRFLGMLSGGEVAEDAPIREAEISYSLPAALIAEAYDEINGN